MEKAVIVSAVRTPIGSFGGVFKDISAVDLGVFAVKEALSRIDLKPGEVDELIFGNVLQAGLGQNVARQVAVGSNIPFEKTSFTINKVCGSGLKAVELAAQAIRLGDADIIVAGGTESMSQSAYVLPSARFGQRMGNGEIVDTMIKDGLQDAFNHYHMGITAENVAEKYHLTRKEQDDLAATSQQKAEKAQKAGVFEEEIVPVLVNKRRGESIVVTTDEYPRAGVTSDGLAKLRPAFKPDGTVTAANSSGINDGAAAVVVMSERKAKELNIPIMAEITAYAQEGVNPALMGTGPIPAVKKVINKANLSLEDIDLFEANEAFAAQALSVIKELNLDTDKVNVNGGAIALGHPIGASGTRILVSLLHEMKKREVKHGLATLCIGGGQGIAMVVSR